MLRFMSARRISTHSLTRRLTAIGRNRMAVFQHFNSQPHKEADQQLSSRGLGIAYFNSQPHKEADA